MDILETAAYDRRQKRNVNCVLLFSLLPFFLSTAVYFYLWTPDWPESIVSAGVKSAPTLLLAAVVLSWNGGQSVLGVGGGLVFSAVGDCCLVWPELFVHGMGAFAVAHLMYSITFLSSRYASKSSSSWKRVVYLIMFLAAGAFYFYIYPFLQKAPDADLIVPGVGVYTALICLMGVLALRTNHVATLLGSASFIVSDIALALQIFKVTPHLKHGNSIVMGTYYLAQLLITVGEVKAVGNKDEFDKWKRS
ncbi:lysoplasmalogenase [Solea solea]|uniref:lysoplasmalogenase n=1 Tax=Solea solea TaxID=90069 RepID=UPI00272BA244|nr:lysoplasmalogenase [Solea solea]